MESTSIALNPEVARPSAIASETPIHQSVIAPECRGRSPQKCHGNTAELMGFIPLQSGICDWLRFYEKKWIILSCLMIRSASLRFPGRSSGFRERGLLVLRVGGFALWLGAAIYGSILLWNFSLEPGQSPAAASQWPATSALTAPGGKPALVLFLHPLCPCSRATVDELSVLLAKADLPLNVQAVFVGEADGGPVEESDLWEQVQALPGVTLRKDHDGVEAAKFHSKTSGDAFLFDAAGRLQFRGGLTAARGHAGDNFGVDSIVRILNEGKAASSPSGPVFGCSLSNPQPPPTR